MSRQNDGDRGRQSGRMNSDWVDSLEKVDLRNEGNCLLNL